MKTILSYIILTFCACSFAQSEPITHKKDRYLHTNFNGSVQHTTIMYVKFKIDNERITQQKIVLNERDIIGIVEAKFDQKGMLLMRKSNYYLDNRNNVKNTTEFVYDRETFGFLKQLTTKNVYPIYDYFFKPKIDFVSSTGNLFFDPSSMDTYKQDSLHKSYEKYLYTLKDNRITEEKNFSLLMAFNQNADPDNLASYIHYQTIEFIYDNTGKLVVQKVKLGNGPGPENTMFNAEQWAIPFHAMGTESGFCEDLHLSYQYDAKDRITDIVFFGCNDTLAKEHYTYDEKAGYVNKIRKYTGGIGGPVSVPKTVDLFYDEHANVIKREFIQPSHHTFSFNDIPQTTYYKYDYDTYNNWIKCYIYYTGKPEGEPTAVVERKIEYYES